MKRYEAGFLRRKDTKGDVRCIISLDTVRNLEPSGKASFESLKPYLATFYKHKQALATACVRKRWHIHMRFLFLPMFSNV